jgi:hypothetical protein
LGFGVGGRGPNPKAPIPNPQSPKRNILLYLIIIPFNILKR